MSVEKFNDMETTFINVEMDISCFKIRGAGFPNNGVRIQAFHFLPCSIPDTLTMGSWMNKQQFQFIVMGGLINF